MSGRESSLKNLARTDYSMNDLRLGAPTIRVKNLESALSFYKDDFGLNVTSQDEENAIYELGFGGDPLIILKHDPNARTPRPNSAGLYHFAVLVPDRRSLASTLLAIGKSGISYDGFADHRVSEALYLHDVELNGIEIYSDRPQNLWPNWKQLSEKAERDGDFSSLSRAMMAPLDFDSLLRDLSKDERDRPTKFPRGARIGHMHLKVTNLQRSVKFYHEKLGFDINVNSSSMGAAFLSVGGYHHHLGLNTWHSLNGTPHEEGDSGLDEFKIILPSEAFRDMEHRFQGSRIGESISIKDPDGIRISLIQSV